MKIRTAILLLVLVLPFDIECAFSQEVSLWKSSGVSNATSLLAPSDSDTKDDKPPKGTNPNPGGNALAGGLVGGLVGGLSAGLISGLDDDKGRLGRGAVASEIQRDTRERDDDNKAQTDDRSTDFDPHTNSYLPSVTYRKKWK